MKMQKRLLIFVIVFTLMVGIMPISAVIADDSVYPTIQVDDEIKVSTYNGNSNGTGTFSFIPAESGHYAFYSYDNDFDTVGYILDEEMNILYSNDDGGEDSNFKVVYHLTAGTQYFMYSKPYYENSSGEYHVKVEKLVPATSFEITTDISTCYVDLIAYLYIAFGPENALIEDVSWTSSNPEIAVIYDVYDDHAGIRFISEGTVTITATTESGLTDNRVIEVYNRPVATKISIENGRYLTGYNGTHIWLGITYYPDQAIREEITWSSDNEQIATVDNDGYVEFLSTGTVNITALSENGLTDTCTINVVEPYVLTLDHSIQIFKPIDNRDQILKFIPPESGLFRFYASDISEDDDMVSMILYDSSMNQLKIVNDNEYLDYELEKDQTYFIETYYNLCYGDGNNTYYINATKLNPATSIGFDIGSNYKGYVGTERSIKIVSNPEHSILQNITWSSSNSNIVSVDSSGYISLNSLGTATITATTEDNLVASTTITVEDFPVISLDDIKTVELSPDDSNAYFKFSPTEDGYYSFYSFDNDYDTYGYILNSDLERIYSDDDSGIDNNFDVRYHLNAGETYVFRSRFYNTDNTGSFKVCVEKKKYVTSIEIVSMPDRTEYVENFVSTPDNMHQIDFYGLKLKFTWSDGSTTDWVYEYEWQVEDENIYVDASNVNETGNVVFTCCDESVTLTFTLIENPVDHIELVTGTEKSYIENYDGYFTENYNNVEFFYYYTYYPADAVIRIVYKNGTSTTANVGEHIDGYVVYWYDNQNEEPWVVGTNNKSTIEYLGQEVNLPITVEQSNVSSIEVVSGKITCIENTYGSEMGNGSFYYNYDIPEDVIIRINYVDGTSKTSSIYDSVDGYRFVWSSDQYDTPWVLGDNNYINVNYLGKETKLPVSIVETPVDHIVINSAPTREYIYGDIEYGNLYSDGEYEFYPTDMTGLSFTVYYKDGTNKTFTKDDITDDGKINGYGYEIYFDEYNLEIGDFPIEFMYMGKTDDYTVVLKESTVSSISVTKQPNRVEYDYMYYPDLVGMEFLITYTNGTKKTVALTADNIVYKYNISWGSIEYTVNVDGSDIVIRKLRNDLSIYVAYYLGAQCEINCLEFTNDKNIDSIDLDNVSMNGDKMVVNITYDDGTSEVLTLNTVRCFDNEDLSCFCLAMTDNGLLTYYIETIVDKSGSVDKYSVYILGENVVVQANTNNYGDVNGDDEITIKDALLTIHHVVGKFTFNDDQFALADVNFDDQITMHDALLILHYVVGKITSFTN